jgi:hypothetical protein
MIGPLLIACLLLAVTGVLSKVFVGRWLEDKKERLNDAQLEVQHTAAQRRQNEDLLAFEENKERRLKSERQIMINQIENLKNRLGGPSPG